MTNSTTFFGLLSIPVDAKGDALADRIAALNATGAAEEAYTLGPAAFTQIPRSPFAYSVMLAVVEPGDQQVSLLALRDGTKARGIRGVD
jgi:hypothetical protein